MKASYIMDERRLPHPNLNLRHKMMEYYLEEFG